MYFVGILNIHFVASDVINQELRNEEPGALRLLVTRRDYLDLCDVKSEKIHRCFSIYELIILAMYRVYETDSLHCITISE